MRHPIVNELIPLLKQENGRFELDKEGQERLGSVLERYKGRPDLKEAAKAILMFGFFLQQTKGSPQPARAIIETLQKFKSAVLASSSILDDVLGSTDELDRMKRTIGDTGQKGKDAPSGPTMSLWETMASD